MKTHPLFVYSFKTEEYTQPANSHMSQLLVTESVGRVHFAQGWQNLLHFPAVRALLSSRQPPVQHLAAQNWCFGQSACPVQAEYKFMKAISFSAKTQCSVIHCKHGMFVIQQDN